MYMKCNEAESLFIDFLNNELDPDMAESLEKHVANCEQCRQQVKEYKEVFAAMGDRRLEVPGPSLRENFHTILQAEINLTAVDHILKDSPKRRLFKKRILWLSAVSVSLIILSIVFFEETRTNKQNIEQQVNETRSEWIIDLLQKESASDRLLALSHAADLRHPDSRMINTLLQVINHDKNVNVRVEAFNVISGFLGYTTVLESLVSSLDKQTEPIVQILIIVKLTEIREVRVVVPIRSILRNKETIEPVRTIAEDSLKMLVG